MDLQVRLDQEWGAYTEKDTVSGQLVLRNKAPVNISTIIVKLFGIATSRLNSGKYIESHQLFQRVQNVFPPQKMAEMPGSRSLTVGCGTHVFPFSLTTRNILFYPVHGFSLPKSILGRRCLLPISHDSVGSCSPLAYQVDVELLNGQCLLLGYPIPLKIKLTKVGDRECFVWLNDFQTMLVGSTETHASGLVEKDTHFQVIQTMSNIHHVVSHDRALHGAELCIGDSLWNKHRLPIALTPSFETCNISQTYTLEVRLGLQCGYSKFRTTILEFSFPVHLTPPSMDPDPYEAKSAKLF
ncbi:hypothetical protein ABOM_011747 [Aspergillus bombycis]|uniref:Arrestin-like N-terminal domain-containing protein n=1 Tax=Aspergillus bombycis TaxID=109264 RepID=A0A1F7ZJ55_9EURO|nr:hypothetical protein ABOM_011747 [Aspergillus bombycis]OGM39487.1 hypothetical protein ABOM_011747 [Aspergillus bombycis]